MPVNNPVGGGGLLVPSIEVHGTSWADVTQGVTDPANKWPSVLAQMCGLDEQRLTNIGINGGQAFGADFFGGAARIAQDNRMQPETGIIASGGYQSFGGAKFCLSGFNDFTLMGNTASSRTAIEHGLTAAWACLRAARYIPYTAFTFTGSWTPLANTTCSYGIGLNYTITNTDRFDIPIPADYGREGITILIPSINGSGGTMTIVLDPAGVNTTLGTYDLAADNTALVAAGQQASGGLGGFRIQKNQILTTGAHTLRCTMSGLSGANYGMVTAAVIDGDAPIIVPQLPHRKNGTIDFDAQMTLANTRNTNVAATFHNVSLVDTNPYLAPGWNGTIQAATDEKYWFSPADVHLSNTGDAQLALAMYTAMASVVTPTVASKMRFRKGSRLQQHIAASHLFVADGTILKGDALIQSTTDGRVVTTTTANSGLIIGVAMHNAILGTPIEVALAGSIMKVNKTAPALPTRGTLVGTSTTAGQVAVATPSHGTIFGKTLEAALINTTDVFCLVQLS